MLLPVQTVIQLNSSFGELFGASKQERARETNTNFLGNRSKLPIKYLRKRKNHGGTLLLDASVWLWALGSMLDTGKWTEVI